MSDVKRVPIVVAVIVVPAVVLFIAAYRQAGKIQAKANSGTMRVWNDRA